MKKIFIKMTIFMFFVLVTVGCVMPGGGKTENVSSDPTDSETTITTEPIDVYVSFLESKAEINLIYENEYFFKYESNMEEAGIDGGYIITCEQAEGCSIITEDYFCKAVFSDVGEYTFNIAIRSVSGEVYATDTMIVTVIKHVNEPLLTVYDNVNEFDKSQGLLQLNYQAHELASVTISSDKAIALSESGIEFLETGVHKLLITASIDEIFETAEIEINVYNILKLFGAGTQANPWLITSVHDLSLISSSILNDDLYFEDNYFQQTQNIDLCEVENWIPIGTIGLPFEGTYDGAGYEVNNLTINTSESFQGLFGFITGVVKNVTVDGEINVTTNNLPYSHSLVGGIVGGMNNGAQVINCVNKVNITADSSAGGIVGEVLETDYYLHGVKFSKVIDCVNYGKITANFKNAINENTMYFGGITAKNHGIIENCINYGEVDAETYASDSINGNDYVGGITGYSYQPFYSGFGPSEQMNYDAISGCTNNGYIHGSHAVGGIVGQHVLNVRNCLNTGNVKGGKSVGGIAGIVGTNGTIQNEYTSIVNCENTGDILTFDRQAGGIAGYSYDDIIDCKNSGNITFEEGVNAQYIGGIVGTKVHGLLDNCLNTGDVFGKYGVGGIAGQNYYEASNCVNYGVVNGENCVGGVLGISGASSLTDYTNVSITNCTNNARVIVTLRNAGGIVGYSYANVLNCNNFGNVEAALNCSTYYVGGIIGNKQLGEVDACSNTGDIYATASSTVVGGIVGENITGTIKNSINSGSVTGVKTVGGIVGRVNGQNYSISNCQSLDNAIITGNDCIGGIAGRVEASGINKSIVIDNCQNASHIKGVTGYIGGIIGMHGSYNVVTGCTNNGSVSGYGYNSSENIGVGGISGQLHNKSKVLNSTNNGDVTGERVTGGIVGSAKPSASNLFEITNCVNNGTITCNYNASKDAWVGGILGYGSNGLLTDNINYGQVINTNGANYVNAIYGKTSNVTTSGNQDLSKGELN